MKGSFTQLILLLLLCPCMTSAQDVTPSIVNTTGGSYTSGYNRFDWSVGEMCIIESYNKPWLILENGFLHPGTERHNLKDPINFFATGDIMIFPNPVFNTTELNINVPEPGRVIIRLIDVMGKIIQTREFDYNGVGRIEKIDLQRYPAGSYMLHLLLTSTDQSRPTRKGTYKLIHITH